MAQSLRVMTVLQGASQWLTTKILGPGLEGIRTGGEAKTVDGKTMGFLYLRLAGVQVMQAKVIEALWWCRLALGMDVAMITPRTLREQARG